jgi:p21-activated kinase 1
MGKSHSGQSGVGKSRIDPGPPPTPGTSAAAALARAHTQKQQQQQAAQAATPRRRDKQKENEETIRQLQAICSPGDPNVIYRGLQKVGQG